jgi:8-oxo-dGTP pyrophosphatase MutT (NUDIX family)
MSIQSSHFSGFAWPAQAKSTSPHSPQSSKLPSFSAPADSFTSQPRFSGIASPEPGSYAKQAFPPPEDKSKKTSVWTPDANSKKPFIAWKHSNHSVVHALTVFKNKDNQPMIRFLIQNRPAMGNIDTVEAPAGKYGDTDASETAELGAQRELEEETGLRPKKVLMLSEDHEDSAQGASIATSPGITNERKAFALILAEETNQGTKLTEAEKQQNVRQLDIPLQTFLNPTAFKEWRKNIKDNGKLVGVDIPTLKGLLPDEKTLKNFLELNNRSKLKKLFNKPESK